MADGLLPGKAADFNMLGGGKQGGGGHPEVLIRHSNHNGTKKDEWTKRLTILGAKSLRLNPLGG